MANNIAMGEAELPTPMNRANEPVLDLPDHVAAHLCKIRIGQAGGAPEAYFYSIRLDDGSSQIDFTNLPVRDSLIAAAWFYAMNTSDYEVTIGDVIENGYYPFDLLPANVDYSLGIYGVTSDYKLTAELLENISSPEWALRMKDFILSAFYREYYFPYEPSEQYLEELLPPGKLSRLEKFWIAPDSDTEAVEGKHAGSLQKLDLIYYQTEYARVAQSDPRRTWQVYRFMFRDCPSLQEDSS
jgi:hypothetical protein